MEKRKPTAVVLIMGLLLLSGCNAKKSVRRNGLYDQIDERGAMVAAGRDAIIAGCAHRSYANARTGLIVGETGLHEDVFELRDRVSFAANIYGMDEALRLEALLREGAKAGGHSAEQANCIDEFAKHLESLTDALTEADNLQKELDLSAFNDSRKQAAEEDKKQHGWEQFGVPNSQ